LHSKRVFRAGRWNCAHAREPVVDAGGRPGRETAYLASISMPASGVPQAGHAPDRAWLMMAL